MGPEALICGIDMDLQPIPPPPIAIDGGRCRTLTFNP